MAVIVDYGNGQVASRCVSFTEESITGYEALQRTGLPVDTDFQTGGAAVCRIDGQGCPSEDCFCSCRGGGECKYWSYWHLNNDVWNYSSAGSSIYRVYDGAVDGWVWGLGSVTQASPPPLMSFDEVCATGEQNSPTPTGMSTVTSTPIVLPTAEPPAAGGASATPTLTPSVTIQSNPSLPSPTSSAESVITGTLPITAPFATRQQELPATVTLSADQFQQLPSIVTTQEPGRISAQEDVASFPGFGQSESMPVTTTPTMVLSEPVTGIEAGESIPSGPEAVELTSDKDQAIAEVNPAGLPLSQSTNSGVIGQGVELADVPLTAKTHAEQDSTDLSDYWAFAGMLLLLAALALFVYRRRRYEVTR